MLLLQPKDIEFAAKHMMWVEPFVTFVKVLRGSCLRWSLLRAIAFLKPSENLHDSLVLKNIRILYVKVMNSTQAVSLGCIPHDFNIG